MTIRRSLLTLVALFALAGNIGCSASATPVDEKLTKAQAKFSDIQWHKGQDPAWLRSVTRSDESVESKKKDYDDINAFVSDDLPAVANAAGIGSMEHDAKILRQLRGGVYVEALISQARDKYCDLGDMEEALRVMKEAGVAPEYLRYETAETIRKTIIGKIEENFKGDEGLLALIKKNPKGAMYVMKKMLDAYNLNTSELQQVGLTSEKAEEIKSWKSDIEK